MRALSVALMASMFLAGGCPRTSSERTSELAPKPAAPAPSTVAAVPSLSSSGLEPATAPRRFELLNGRLSAVLPAGGRLLDLEERLVPPPGVNAAQSRHVVDDGALHVAIASFELFGYAGEDFERSVRAAVGLWDHPPQVVRLEALATPLPLRVLQLTLPTPARAGLSDDVGILSLVSVLYVAHSDGTAQAIELHTDDRGCADPTRVIALARRMGESLEVGPLVLSRAAGLRTLPLFRARILADAPDGLVGVLAEGIDYTLASLIPIKPLGTPGASIELFISNNGEPAPAGARGPTVASRVFGVRTRLRRTSTAGRRALVGSVYVDGRDIQLTISASSAAELESLRVVAETLRLEEDE